jgi:hypothetical protein
MNEFWVIVVPDVRREAYAGHIDIKKEIATTTNYLKIKNSIPALAVHHKFITTMTKVAPLRGVPEVGHPMVDRGLGAAQASGRAILIRFIDPVVLLA